MTNTTRNLVQEHFTVAYYYPMLPKGQGIRSARTITQKCTLRNSSNVPLIGKFYAKENTWTLRSIDKSFKVPPRGKVDIEFELFVRPGQKTIEDIPETFEYSFLFTEPGFCYEICKLFTHTLSDVAIGMLYDSVPKPPESSIILNIVIVGPPGAGKSSFLNSMFTLFSEADEVVTNRVQVGGLDTHTTKTIRRYRLPAPMDKVAFWDTFGINANNYLNHLCKGILPDGFHMDDGIDANLVRQGRYTAESRRPVAILVFLPEGQITDEESIKALKLQLGLLKDAGMNPIFVVSLVDKKFPELLNNAMCVPTGLKDKLRQVSEAIGAPLNRVTYCVSYDSQTKRNFFIDQHNYILLEKALRAAGEYIASQSEAAAEQKNNFQSQFQFDENKNEIKSVTAAALDASSAIIQYDSSEKTDSITKSMTNPQEGDGNTIGVHSPNNSAKLKAGRTSFLTKIRSNFTQMSL